MCYHCEPFVDDGGVPACMSWPVPEPGTTIQEWQQGRCAGCDRRDNGLLLDHDHDTELVRGYLCRSCNVVEGVSPKALWKRWRSGWNPAVLLGVAEEYEGNWAYQMRKEWERSQPEPSWDGLRAAIDLLGDAS